MESDTINQNQPTKQPKNPLLIGGIVVLVLFVGGGFFLLSGKDNSGDSLTPSSMPTNSPKQVLSTSPSPATQAYTLEEVAEHNTEADCWLAIDGKVYDATKFIPTHPGGKAIINGCGKDATVFFNERPTNNKGPHPAQALEKLKELYIGDLKS